MCLCIVKEHFTLFEKILACLYQYIFYCKLKKFSFLYNSTIFLSFANTPKGMYISYLKVWSLNEWLVTTIVK